MCNIRFQV